MVYKISISCRLILEHLTTGPVILLTNAKLLGCDICRYNKIGNELKKMFRWPVPYQGHYIVLCGYNMMMNKVFYRNPTLNDSKYMQVLRKQLFKFGNLSGICVMSIRSLEEARKSYGTDQDTIFIYPSQFLAAHQRPFLTGIIHYLIMNFLFIEKLYISLINIIFLAQVQSYFGNKGTFLLLDVFC